MAALAVEPDRRRITVLSASQRRSGARNGGARHGRLERRRGRARLRAQLAHREDPAGHRSGGDGGKRRHACGDAHAWGGRHDSDGSDTARSRDTPAAERRTAVAEHAVLALAIPKIHSPRSAHSLHRERHRRKPRWPDLLPLRADPVRAVAGFRDRLASCFGRSRTEKYCSFFVLVVNMFLSRP